ncbi:hypothetical protein CYMTET_4611 [Cymbomonas tetramitiformis]|uniref:Uncharacterized protein n=1 Tax=Cymbomonas tetramitiformis TaxID=36881 RepID=A0AAE0LKB8_9CHLO|nr:hypothetical protein CYMTET_4611 [Cymbomonas tetramitiformis]
MRKCRPVPTGPDLTRGDVVDIFATAQADVGRIGDGYATGKATKSGISNLVIARATVAAFGPGKSLNEMPMVLPSDVYELYIEFVVHLPEGGDVYPVERLLSHHMSMVDELVDAEQLRTGTSAKKLADLEHSLKIHNKAYLRHANEKHVYPEKLTARKLVGLNLEPAEDVRGRKMGPQTEEPLPDGKTEEEAYTTGEGGDDEEDGGDEEDDEEVAAEGDDAAAAAGGGEGEVVEEEEEEDKAASEDDDTETPMGEDDSKKEEKKGASKEPLYFQKNRKPEPAVKEAQKQAKKPRAS